MFELPIFRFSSSRRLAAFSSLLNSSSGGGAGVESRCAEPSALVERPSLVASSLSSALAGMAASDDVALAVSASLSFASSSLSSSCSGIGELRVCCRDSWDAVLPMRPRRRVGVPGLLIDLSLSLSLSFSIRTRLCSGVADADADIELLLKLPRRPSLRLGGVPGGLREESVATDEDDIGRDSVVVRVGGRGGGDEANAGDGEGRRGGGGDELVCVGKGSGLAFIGIFGLPSLPRRGLVVTASRS